MRVEQAPQHLPHHLPTLGEMLEWIGHHKTRLTMAAIALGGAGYLMVAHDRGSQNPAVTVNNPISDTLKPADPGADSEVIIPAVPTEVTPAAGASPSPEPPKPTPALEPAKTPPSPTAEPTKAAIIEAEKDKPCTIVPEKYCSQGQIIHTKNQLGQPVIYIGFRLPADTPISAGKDGQLLNADIGQPAELQGILATIRDPNLNNPNATAFDVIGAIRLNTKLSVNVKKGDTIGYIQDTGIKNFGDYNLLVRILRLDPSVRRAVPAEDILKELFSQAFTKPPITLDYQGPDKPANTILSPIFSTSK